MASSRFPSFVFIVAVLLVVTTKAAGTTTAATNTPLPMMMGTVNVVAVDLFWNYIGSGSSNASFGRHQMKTACIDNGFKFIRFAATPFWPRSILESGLFTSNDTQFWSTTKMMLEDAQSFGCTLMPSFFWNWFAYSDIFNETLGSDLMRNKGSRSRVAIEAFLRKYIALVNSVENRGQNRNQIQAEEDRNGIDNSESKSLSNSTAASLVVGAWELGNELNLLADLNLTKSQIAPYWGTPTIRSTRDNFSLSDMMIFEEELATIIRDADNNNNSNNNNEHQQKKKKTFFPNGGSGASGLSSSFKRPISTGHAIPRVDAYHLAKSYRSPQRDWTLDTLAQFTEILVNTSRCCEMVSIHCYATGCNDRFGVSEPYNAKILSTISNIIDTEMTDHFLYLGEFGDPLPGTRPWSHAVLAELNSIRRNAPSSSFKFLSTIWVWEFYQDSRTLASNYSLIPGRDDAFIAQMRAFNGGK